MEWFALLATRNGRTYLELTIPNNVIMVEPKPKPSEKTVFPKEGGPQPPGQGPVLVHTQEGSSGKQMKFHLLLHFVAAPHCSHYCLNPNPNPNPSSNPHSPHPWKNCLPQNGSLVPKMLGTTAPKELGRKTLVSLAFGQNQQ